MYRFIGASKIRKFWGADVNTRHFERTGFCSLAGTTFTLWSPNSATFLWLLLAPGFKNPTVASCTRRWNDYSNKWFLLRVGACCSAVCRILQNNTSLQSVKGCVIFIKMFRLVCLCCRSAVKVSKIKTNLKISSSEIKTLRKIIKIWRGEGNKVSTWRLKIFCQIFIL